MALDDGRWDRALAVGAGTAMAAPVLHYTLFPWRLRFGVPVLEEAEGLKGLPLAGYVALLYAWASRGCPPSSNYQGAAAGGRSLVSALRFCSVRSRSATSFGSGRRHVETLGGGTGRGGNGGSPIGTVTM